MSLFEYLCAYIDNGIVYTHAVNHKKRDILFLTITLANLDRFFFIVFISFSSWRNSTCDCSKIYHITL